MFTFRNYATGGNGGALIVAKHAIENGGTGRGRGGRNCLTSRLEFMTLSFFCFCELSHLHNFLIDFDNEVNEVLFLFEGTCTYVGPISVGERMLSNVMLNNIE